VTFDLQRYKDAQDAGGFAHAIAELTAGAKRSHWIWYIFPQLAGLGSSPMAETYGLHGAEEAAAYLRDPVLRERLLAAMNVVRAQSAPLRTLMGSQIDVLKLVSSMTLFREVARREKDNEVREAAGAILATAEEQGFSGCEFTRRQLSNPRP
jgi:uncharacterized protein (DUF1810 family)